MSKFDYYRATFFDLEQDEIIASLVNHFDLSSVRSSIGKHGFTRGATIHRGDVNLATVWWGGNNPGTCVSLSSDNASNTVPFLRSLGSHQVTRADVCWDLEGPGLFDQITSEALAFAVSYGLKIGYVGDWERGVGRTLYVGSRNSEVYLRIYEKGYEQAHGSPDWVRVEAEVKPSKKDGKMKLSTMTIDQIWGVSWLSDFCRIFDFGTFPQSKLKSTRKPTDFERAKYALAHQYGPTLSRMYQEAKSAEAFVDDINAILTEIRSQHALTVS
jgi:DNA relaxase NicK